MTDSEKMDLILDKLTILDDKVSTLDDKVTALENDMIEVKTDLKRLHRNDDLILNEVERVHEILNTHINDTTKHTA